MKRGLSSSALGLIALALLGLVGACDDNKGGTRPSTPAPLTEAKVLTLNLDAGAPVALEDTGSELAIAYSCLFEGSGDIFRLVLTDSDGDGLYDSYDTVEEYPNSNDTTIHYTRTDQTQFSTIGEYEVTEGASHFPSDPAGVFFAGPRQLFYDPTSDRIFYSMAYGTAAQIASTVAPLDATGGHTGDIVNEYDPALKDFSTDAGRAPNWQYWYTKRKVGTAWKFSGGLHAAVSPVLGGVRWLAYADSLLESYDHDGDELVGEDPVGAIEVVRDGLPDDGAPGILGEDDDGKGDGVDFDDLEVASMLVVDPPVYSLAWSMQNYVPAWDDDEDGRIDEDRLDSLDNDGDGLFDEDPKDPPFDDDGDGLADEDPIDGVDNDGDGLIDEDPYIGIDNDGDGFVDEDPLDSLDNDGDGLFDEDQPGDMNGDGYPGVPGDELDDGGPITSEDTLGDLEDPEVKHSNLRALGKATYDPTLDDDEDGISDEDADFAQNGIWVVRIGADGLPDSTATPINLTDDRGRQPFFNPTGSDLLYVVGGDIHRLTLEATADTVIVLSDENLTSSAALEAFPAYSDNGDRIVYSSSAHGSSDIYFMDAAGSVTRVTNAPGQELYPRFTPNGQQILYEGWLFPEGVRRVMITVEPLP
ncbi:MAG: hypothetical protein R3C71_03990 [Candidatus Krumholzibacteriia bacterium]|nr:PD40 domain-containing protein [bacterium]MCB9513222.1 PD40 domain-containing protein [Candidatus Latescibacterota bacterium]MCB9514686.1 PD40 domain-containing protein [Candidatus Latescibacterota bacterium]